MADTRPSDRAMTAAVQMEMHAACSTTTLAKGKALDEAFPAYDDILDALKEATLALDGFAKGEGVFKPIEQTIVFARAAIAKAEGRAQ